MIDTSNVRSVRRRPLRLGDATDSDPRMNVKTIGIKPAMNCHLFQWSFAAVFACFTCTSIQAAEDRLLPAKKDGTQADSVVCCRTPIGWQGWKDDPKRSARAQKEIKDDPLGRAFYEMSVWFHQPNCQEGRPECPYLSLEPKARDSRGQPDVKAGLRDLLNPQLMDRDARLPPCVVVSRFGSFHTEKFGVLTIWRIRCPSSNHGVVPEHQHLVTLLAHRDVLVTIELVAPDIKDIVPKVDSLKELARSVRIIDAKGRKG